MIPIQERTLCLRCLRPLKICFCKEFSSFNPDVKIVILMHPMEFKKEKVGTGRMGHLLLEDSEIIMGIDFTHDKRVSELLNDSSFFPVLLYPGEQSLNISKNEITNAQIAPKKLLVFVIDGTWPCAKKIMRLSKNLHSLQRISFDVQRKSEFLIKQQPARFCLSTIEALHEFFLQWQHANNFSYEGKEDVLMSVFKKIVEFQKKCAEDPDLQSYRKKRPYKEVEERKASKKWETRKIFF